MLNPFFLQGSKTEQNLIQDLVNEHLRMYGVEVYYLPRFYLTEKTIIKEVIESSFDRAYPIEAYVETYDGYGNNPTILSKFGIQALNEITLTISRERFETYISPLIIKHADVKLATRPKEGDLVYFPLGDRLFEIKYVEHEKPFYQLQGNYTYELRCELFQYEDEVIDTGVGEIDDVLAEESFTEGEQNLSTIVGNIQLLNLVGAASTATAITSLVDGAVRFITIKNRGGGYTSAPRVAISSAPSGGRTAAGIANMIEGIVVCNDNVNPLSKSVQSVGLTTVGSGYTMTPKVKFIGGDGSGAIGIASLAYGSVGVVTITSGGGGYVGIPTVLFSKPKHVGAKATATIDTVISTGASVLSINLTKGGPAYLFTDTTGGRFYKPGFIPTVTIDLPTGSANNATASATMGDYNTTGGTVAKISVTNEGKFYTTAPTVTISHPGYSYASGTIGIAGSSIDPNSFTFTSSGRAYRTAPVVSISTYGSQRPPLIQAIGIATINPITGVVTAVGFDQSLPWCVGTGATIGLGYTVAPQIIFSGGTDPVRATATATVSIAGTISSISIGNSGFGYASGVTATVSIGAPAGIGEQFRAIGVATMRYNSVITTGTIAIGSTIISGIATEGILIGDRVRLPYNYTDVRKEYNFIPDETYVDSIGIGTIFISSTSTNTGIATTTFEFGIDQCGIVTGITVTYGGGGYLVAPNVTIQNDPDIKNYVELIAGVHTARGYAVVSAAGTITQIAMTDAGSRYVITPTISIAGSGSTSIGTFEFNEVVTGSISGTTAKVRDWDAIKNQLQVYKVNGEFISGEVIVGSSSSARYTLKTIDEFYISSGYGSNEQIEIEADEILDFSEKNPFGMP